MTWRGDPPPVVAGGPATVPDELPACVIATRAGVGEPWRAGAARERSHAHWRARTVDPAKKRKGHTADLSFDAPVAPGTTLADPARGLDATTKRELLVRAMAIGFGAGRLGAIAAAALALKYDWVVRWRLDHGVPAFAGLDATDYDAFVARLRTGTVLDLVDIGARLDAWAAEVSAGALPSPLRGTGAGARVHRGKLAEQLGVTTAALSGSAGFDDLLEARLARLVPGRTRSKPDPAPAITRKGPVTASAMVGYLDVWRCLSVASRVGLLPHDPLRFDPAERGAPGRVADRLGAPGARTATIEPPAMFALLLAATRCVLEDGPALVAALAGLASTATGAAGVHDPDHRGMPLARAVRHLMAACAIIVGGLAGRRIRESESARAGCVREPMPGLHEIELYVEKSTQDLDGIVAPALVAVALRTLEEMTAPSRAITGEHWLFRLVLPSGRVVDFAPSVDLPAFAAARGWDAGPRGAPLASHQLRRGHALWSYHGYVLGSLEAVGRQLRHGGPDATATYVTEVEPGGTIRLRDELAARSAAALAALPEADRARLRAERARLSRIRDSGGAFDGPRCEEAALALLEAWPDGMPGEDAGAGSPADRFARMKARAAPTIRIGSQARRPGDPAEPPLLDAVRAHAAALFGPGAA